MTKENKHESVVEMLDLLTGMAGVDNWDGYDLAKEMYHDEE